MDSLPFVETCFMPYNMINFYKFSVSPSKGFPLPKCWNSVLHMSLRSSLFFVLF